MNELRLHVLSLRYSSWSIRPFLALTAAKAAFDLETVELPDLGAQPDGRESDPVEGAKRRLEGRRTQGSVTGLFPVLYVDGTPIHESLAICEWVADAFPDAGLWPEAAVERAQARSISCEMLSGFAPLRTTMSCQVFARVPDFQPDPETRVDIDRIFEIWQTALDASGGPLLFGSFGIADCMFFPVLTRFRTYGIALSPELEAYARALEESPPVRSWRDLATSAPRIPAYDEHVRSLGGDPDAVLSV